MTTPPNSSASTAVGGDIRRRAVEDLGDASFGDVAVDHGDAADAWWDAAAESDRGVKARVADLFDSLMLHDDPGGAILVTHSNFLRHVFRNEVAPGVAGAAADCADRKLRNCGVVAFKVDFAKGPGARIVDARLLFGSTLASAKRDFFASRSSLLAQIRERGRRKDVLASQSDGALLPRAAGDAGAACLTP